MRDTTTPRTPISLPKCHRAEIWDHSSPHAGVLSPGIVQGGHSERDKLLYCSEDAEVLMEQRAHPVRTECGQQLPSLPAWRPGEEGDLPRAQGQCVTLWEAAPGPA